MTPVEQDILDGCLKQERKFQKMLYEKYASKMLGVCRRYTRDEYEAENILQESFIKVFENIVNFKPVGSLEGWIRRIMVNTATDYYRKIKRVKYIEENVEDHHDLSTIDLDQFGVNDILNALQELPEGSRMVFNMFAIEGYSHADISKELGISVGTSKSQYSRAKQLLKERLEKLDKNFFLKAK